MAKLVLNDIQSGYQTADQYNENNRLIEEALENTVSRDGTTPNTLLADLDANSNSINNIQTTRTQVLYINGQQATVGAIGEKGEQGDAGTDGVDGVDGTDGTDGVDGITGVVVQVVNMLDGEVATGNTAMNYSDIDPHITEGDEYMTLAVTPQFATSKLKIDVVINLRGTIAGVHTVAALFQDTTPNALCATTADVSGATYAIPLRMTHWITSGYTNATTFKVRAGGTYSETLTMNGISGNRKLGGVMYSSMTITEYMA